MRDKKEILSMLQENILILDGATGTELQKRGMPTGVCPELWILEHPEVIQELHKDYEKAGSNIVYSCTFGGNPYKLKEFGASDVFEINKALVSFSKEVLKDTTLVAGDISSTGKFIEPFGELAFEEAVDAYKHQIEGLVAGGADLLVIETMIDVQEARAALIAAKETNPDIFTMVSLTFEENGRTLNGSTPEAALITLQSLGADAVGCNCSTGPEEMLEIIKRLKPISTIPLVAKPNAGMPMLIGSKTVFPMDAAEFGSCAEDFAKAGISIMGGCCGTTPSHIKALSEALRGEKPVRPPNKSIRALSSAREAAIIGDNSPLQIIGERINPTGKKKLQAELKEGNYNQVQNMAREQEAAGAALLDVNAGMPGVNETEVLLEMIRRVSPKSGLPLVIDSTNITAIEEALRLYPGRALVNSVSGEKEKIEKLVPIAAKYGAMLVVLPLTDDELPKTAQRRIAIFNDIFKTLAEHGFTKEDIIVDGLVMTVSSQPEAALETLEMVRWCSKEFGCSTVLGLSNISFGLPERKWVNSSFLTMAMANGLSFAIANPSHEILMNAKRAGDVLTQRDKDASTYIRHFSQIQKTGEVKKESIQILSPQDRVFQGVLDGVREDIRPLVREAAKETAAGKLLEDYMIPAIMEIGKLYEQKSIFLPQLIASAETMTIGFSILEPLLDAGSRPESLGKIIFATVEGDIHDIGKNIVILMLKNYGFEVVDLGKDVPAEAIIEAAQKEKPQIIALSALMTTTMVKMPEVINLAKKVGLDCKFMVGGAVVTPSYARDIGAHYSKDGVEAIKIAKELVGKV